MGISAHFWIQPRPRFGSCRTSSWTERREWPISRGWGLRWSTRWGGSPARFSVNQVVLVNLVFVVLMIAGVTVARKIPVDVFPDISFNSAVLTTIWPGASPDEVERLVTQKIEEEVRAVAGIKTWFSFSSQGLSQITIEWE